ncbi:MAG: hypothetical protein M3442_07490, partial [Chloroflexota bacterium]|nr:hypothetical protein [Chloroflexota bacterium]
LSPDQVERVRHLTGEHGAVSPERVLLCCSHTHGGPGTRHSASLPVNEVYLAALEQHLAGVVYAAAQYLRPVALGLGHGTAGFNVNRRLRLPDGRMAMRPNPEGPVDHDVAVLRFDLLRAADGRGDLSDLAGQHPLAVLFRYTCHATSLGAQNYLFTADYPGAARRYVERAYGAAATPDAGLQTTALFLPGCFGDIRPCFTGPEGGFRSATWAELEALGRQLGSAAVQACEAVRDPTSTRPSQEPEGDLAGPVGAASRQIELPLEPNDAGRATWPAEVQVLRIGGVYLVGLPGEVFLEIGRRAQQAVAGAVGLPAERVLVQGYSNGSIGYVPTAAAIPEGGYEVGAWKMSDRPAGFTGDAERLLADTAATLAAHLVG